MFVIKRTDQGGGYLAQPGRKNTYTHFLQHARPFDTREDADYHRCPENEVVIEVSQIMGGM